MHDDVSSRLKYSTVLYYVTHMQRFKNYCDTYFTAEHVIKMICFHEVFHTFVSVCSVYTSFNMCLVLMFTLSADKNIKHKACLTGNSAFHSQHFRILKNGLIFSFNSLTR